MERERNVYKRAKTESRMHEGDEERRECAKTGAKWGPLCRCVHLQ